MIFIMNSPFASKPEAAGFGVGRSELTAASKFFGVAWEFCGRTLPRMDWAYVRDEQNYGEI